MAKSLAGAVGLGAVMAATMSTPAWAQQASGESGAQGGDIIVTARRVEERLQDVPISITVFNQQQLANRNVTNSSDLANYTPSLSANNNFGQENSSFSIRGFVQEASTPPSVGVYFADVVAPRGGTQGTTAGDGAGPGQFFDLQNVQVLKGPQGTLFGRNTTGGAVLFVPQKPTDKFEGYIEGSIGNYDMKRIQAVVNVPLSDRARFRIAVDRQTRDGWLKNDSGIGPAAFNDIDYTAVRASLVLGLTPTLENYTIASYSNSHTNGSVQKLIGCNPSAAPANLIGRLSCAQLATEQAKGAEFFTAQNSTFTDPVSKLEQWQLINTTTWHASDLLVIKNIVSYAQIKDFLRTSLFGVNWNLGGVSLPFTGVSPLPGGYIADQSTLTEEIQLQGSSADKRLVYQGGFYLESSQPLATVGTLTPQFTACTNLATLQCTALLPAGAAANYSAGRTHYHDIGIYAQASYSLTDTLKLTGGIRYTWDRIENQTSRITYTFPTPNVPVPRCTDAGAPAPSCTAYQNQSSQAPTWVVDLDYKPISDVLLYAKYSRGYRAGGLYPNAPSSYRTFSPEKVDTYEIGVKTSFPGAVHGTFDVTGFYNDFTNQQLLVGFTPAPGATVAPANGIVNAGKSRIYGVEVESTVTPFAGFTLDASYTYLNASIRQIAAFSQSDPNYVINYSIQPGQPLSSSPRNKLSVTGTYTLPLDESIGKVSFGATYTHVDSQLTNYAYNDPNVLAAFGTNLGILPPHDLLNLNFNWASVAGFPVDLSLFATNVTNQRYYAWVPGLAASGFETATLGEPRMYGARLRYRFGS